MTRKTPAKSVDAAYARGRLTTARDYLEAARREAGDHRAAGGNPAISLIVHAAIAFTDALTAKYGSRVNQQDHAGAVTALRDALANRLPQEQAHRLARILAEKDSAEYSPRRLRIEEAQKLLVHLEAYAEWAEALLTP